jgi:hypothetical protein
MRRTSAILQKPRCRLFARSALELVAQTATCFDVGSPPTTGSCRSTKALGGHNEHAKANSPDGSAHNAWNRYDPAVGQGSSNALRVCGPLCRFFFLVRRSRRHARKWIPEFSSALFAGAAIPGFGIVNEPTNQPERFYKPEGGKCL